MNREQILAMTEVQFQSLVIELADLGGWWHYHPYDSRRSTPGFPDLTLAHPVRGRILYRELKTETGRVSAAQLGWLSTLRDAGADAAVWRPSAMETIKQTLLPGRHQ
jgi:hypothetical protein